MIRVSAPSRLHFGLFRLPVDQAGYWPDQEGRPTVPARNFGGVGLMIDKPGVQVRVEAAGAWSASGPLSERALSFGRRFVESLALADEPAFQITVESCPPEHTGLGTGTQLGLAVAKGIALCLGSSESSCVDLAKRIGRGERSAIGIHGFEHGGLIVDGGKSEDAKIAPLVAHVAFPEDWSILLILPEDGAGTHGQREREAFAKLAQGEQNLAHTDALCRLVLIGMLPALAERDWPAFGEALYDFNRRVGEMFAPWQRGIYADPYVASMVRNLRNLGIKGVGQSSWGPVVYGVLNSGLQAMETCDWLYKKHQILPERVIGTSASNAGAIVEA